MYIQTGKVKDVSKQIHANPKIEICAFKNGEWLRVAGELIEDDRREARQSMLDAYPSLQNMYSADDGNTEVFYLKNATATFSSFTHEPEVVLSLIHISEPTRLGMISYAVFCLKKKKKKTYPM